ncbi:MAG: sodium:calcium antiporter [Halorientalis sp.]
MQGVSPLVLGGGPRLATAVVLLLASFGSLLLGAEIFTNGVEWLGHHLGVSESATGSILAAVGTALPETMIPVIAIVHGIATGSQVHAEEVGVGAILGAPFMLATIALFLVGSSVLYFSERRLHGRQFHFDATATRRDLAFFLVSYSLGLGAAFLPPGATVASLPARLVVAAALVGLYLVYVRRSLRAGGLIADEGLESLYLGLGVERVRRWRRGPTPGRRGHGEDPHRGFVLLQTVVALAFIVAGAQLFVTEVRYVSVEVLHVPTAVLALLVAPLATELPEKLNSIIWISRDKDTLAIGNITGAMAFQSTLPVTLGIVFTSWNLSFDWGTTGFLNAFSAVLALVSGAVLYLRARSVGEGDMRPLPFLVGGVFYLLFLAVVVYHVFVLGLVVGA